MFSADRRDLRALVACLVCLAALALGISACGGGEEADAAAASVRSWMNDVVNESREAGSITEVPPATDELLEASSVGYRVGEEVGGASAADLRRETGVELEEARDLYCDFFVEYVGQGEEESLETWILGYLPETPPQRMAAVESLFTNAANSADSSGEVAFNTASATVCSF